MAIFPAPSPHERLNVFFGTFFREMRKAPPEAYGAFLARAEEEFRRAGYREKADGVENILIVRLDEFGDIIITSGFIREVRRNFPKARITLVVKSLARPLVELCPYVNEVMTFDIKSFDETFLGILEKIAVFCRDKLWREHFSIAFTPKWDGDIMSGILMTWLSGARERIGYGMSAQQSCLGNVSPQTVAQDNFFLTKAVVTPRNVVAMPARFFYLLEAAGLKVTETHMELFYGAEDLRRAKELLADLPSGKKVLLGIGAGSDSRKYPIDKYLVALRELVKKDLVFVIVGGKAELNDANFIEQNLPRGKVLNLVCKTTLRETEAIVAQTDFYIGNDTGVMHMAAAAHLPVLVLSREATDMENILPELLSLVKKFPPWQTKSIILRPAHPLGDCATLPPCFGYCHHSEAHCITQITPQEIIAAFEQLQTL